MEANNYKEEEIQKLQIIEHSQKIRYSWFGGECFEDSALEEEYQKYLFSLPRKPVYVICLLQLFFYGFNLYFSNSMSGRYANVAYNSTLGIIIGLQIALLIVIFFSKHQDRKRIIASKILAFLLFLIFGLYNLLLLYVENKQIFFLKNFYLIGVICYFSYSMLMPNSKLTLLFACVLLTLCLVLMQVEISNTVESITLSNCSPDNSQSPMLYQEIICNCLCLLSYFLNNDHQINKRNTFLAKENIRKLFFYYESMVSSLTHQVVSFSDSKIVYENNSFKEKISNFLKTFSQDDLMMISKVNINDNKNTTDNCLNVQNLSEPNIRLTTNQVITDQEDFILSERARRLDGKSGDYSNAILEDNKDKSESSKNPSGKWTLKVKGQKKQHQIQSKAEFNEYENSFLIVKHYLEKLVIITGVKKIKLGDVVSDIYNAFTNNSFYKYYDGATYRPCTKFASLGIYHMILLEQNEDLSSTKKPEFVEKIYYFEVSFRSFPLHDSSSYIVDVVFNDITKIKEVEKFATESKLKHTLFSKIAHEFKTPLTSIIAIIDEMQENLKKQNLLVMEKQLLEVTNLSNYTIFLINDIIQYSNDDNSEIKIKKDSIDLNSICNFCFNIQKCLLSAKSAKSSKVKSIFEFDKTINCYELMSDEIRLKQILLNLISNSVKFTKSGYIKLKAEVVNSDEDNAYDNEKSEKSSINGLPEKLIKVSVSDTGIGMKPEDLQKILNKENGLIVIDTAKEYNKLGSGLGLHIVRTICGMLNANLKITSVYGKGSNFSIYLRPTPKSQSINFLTDDLLKEIDVELGIPDCQRVKSLANSERSFSGTQILECKYSQINSPLSLSRAGSVHFRIRKNNTRTKREFQRRHSTSTIGDCYNNSRCKILIVDDNKTIRKSYINILNSFSCIANNYDLVEYDDGIDLIKAVIEDQHNDNQIKAVFTDENMEYINGSEAIKIMRDLENNSKIKKCLYFSITAFEDQESIQRIVKAGADLVLSKPASKKQIQELIELYFTCST